jgi:oxygen-dependent protoporphyrinogen oxidase
MRAGARVVCLESATRAGGMLGTRRRDGFMAETGPHSMRISGRAIPTAIGLAGMESRLVDANPAAKKKFVTRDGKPVATPASPFGAIGTPLLSLRGKLRMLREPFIGMTEADAEESVADFVCRRLGDEALDRMVDAVVGGIYAGSPKELSVRHAFPSLHRMECEHGSIIRGLLATRGERRTVGKPRIVSFAGGMTELVDSLAGKLGESLRLGTTVTEIEKVSGGWRVAWREGTGEEKSAVFTSVVITTPPWRWASLPLPKGLDKLSATGGIVPCPPVAVVTLGYARERVTHPLDGFGVLSPGIEKRKALGVVFPSSIFPGRAPDGAVTLASFIGGSRSPELGALPETDLARLAREECESLLGASGSPDFVHVTKWAHAIPQYDRNHGALLASLDEAERAMPGLYFCGNYRGGVSLPATLDNAVAMARKITN